MAGASDAAAQATAEDAYQVFFTVAMTEVERGNYATAVKLLLALSRKVDSPRVRLELARAYFLDRRYAQSRSVFEDVLQDPDLPWGVRENVNRYLDLIDDALGTVRFSVAFVTDSNPLNFTDRRQINIAGTTLDVVPPPDHGRASAIQYRLNVTRAFTADTTVVGFADLLVKDFEGGDLDRWALDAGLAFFPRAPSWLEGSIGLEEAYAGGRHFYRKPYVTLTYLHDPVQRFRLETELRLAYLDVADFDHLDAHTQQIAVRGSRVLDSGIQLIGDGYVENAITDEDPYSYRGAGIGGTVSVPVIGSWGVSLSGSIGERRYRASDPLFGETREDTTRRASIILFNRRWTALELRPAVGVAYERTDSSLPYFEYDKLTWIFNLEY